MPENPQPPNWGPANDERALEALLSGEAYRIPDALVPVAGAVDALRAAPLRGELSGEGAARAAFRAAVPVPVPWAGGAEHGTVGAEHGTVTARTLVPPSGNREQRTGMRHRHRRKTGTRPARLPFVVAVGAAGVAVISVAVALTGALPGSFAQTGNRTAGTSASGSGTAAPSTTQRVDGAASLAPAVPDGSAAYDVPHANQSPGDLCREYYSFFEHTEPPSSYPAEAALRAKLNALVGNPAKVLGYCVPYLGNMSVGEASGTSTASPPDIYSGGVGATASPAPSPSDANSGSGKSSTGGSGSGGSGSGGSGAGGSGSGGSGGSGSGGSGGHTISGHG